MSYTPDTWPVGSTITQEKLEKLGEQYQQILDDFINQAVKSGSYPTFAGVTLTVELKVPQITVGGTVIVDVSRNLQNVAARTSILQKDRSGNSLYTGDILYHDSVGISKLAVGTTGQVLMVDTGVTGKLKWSSVVAALSGLTIDASKDWAGKSITNLGTLGFGADVNLYRGSANVLKTDDYLSVPVNVMFKATRKKSQSVGSETVIKCDNTTDFGGYNSGCYTYVNDSDAYFTAPVSGYYLIGFHIYGYNLDAGNTLWAWVEDGTGKQYIGDERSNWHTAPRGLAVQAQGMVYLAAGTVLRLYGLAGNSIDVYYNVGFAPQIQTNFYAQLMSAV